MSHWHCCAPVIKTLLDHCDRLENLITHIDTQGIDDDARKAARNIVRYFSTSALLHHRDEEEDLFPRLNRQSIRIAELIRDLKQEHENWTSSGKSSVRS